MEHYEQMEFDVTLDSERELKENINVAVDFACRQLMATKPPTVGSRQEGYGIAAQYFGAVNRAMDGLKAGMKQYLAILGATDADAVNAASSLHNEAVDLVEQAIGMAVQMNRVMNDLYAIAASQKTPIEEMLEEDDGFEDAEEGPQDDEPEEEEE